MDLYPKRLLTEGIHVIEKTSSKKSLPSVGLKWLKTARSTHSGRT